MSVARKGVWTALVAVVCTVGLLAGAGSALATTKTFTYTGKEEEFKVPAGVTSVHVVAVGGAGGSGAGTFGGKGGAGGLGAVVSGDLGVTAGETLYVEVGGMGPSEPESVIGAFNGGGATSGSGAGGGASDVRTVSISAEPGAEPSPGNKTSLDSRKLIAAGGGGGGEGVLCTTAIGGAGGNAEQEGHRGEECEAFGGGGGAGKSTEGGEGGTSSLGGIAGEMGKLGAGGGNNTGGGGGGGRYGGGSGGEGLAAGGGGGGSNLVPPGGTAKVAKAKEEASVTITYTVTSPDLSLENKASPSPVVSGNTLTYTLTVTNTGGETATKVRLVDLLPESAVFKSLNTTQGTCFRKVGPPGTPKPKDGGVGCELGSLEGGKTATVTITVTPTKPGTLEAKAIVTASNVTSDANDEETATTKVLGD
jgi:uncharacterized repeat protein (TIGR01451 family)